MFTPARLNQCFTGLVGFLQPSDPGYNLIDADLTAASSGRYIQYIHALCTLENIYNSAPEFDKYTYPNWAAGVYSISTVVLHGGLKYKANAAVTGADLAPGISPKWTLIDPFSEYLRETYRAAVLELAENFVTAKKLDSTQKSLVDSLRLYEGMGMLNDRIIKHGRFVGFEIKLSAQEGIQVAINKLGLQTDTIQNDLDFYLYHSSVLEPLEIFTLNFTKADTFQWTELTAAVLKHYDLHDTDGVFYFGYFEDDLIGQAVKKTINWSSPCWGCNGSNYKAWQVWSKYATFRPVYFETSALNGTNLPDTASVQYSSDSNWGLNFSMTVSCDLSEFFCLNKALVADALAMKLCIKFLNAMAFSTRLNGVADKVKALAMAELDPAAKSGSFSAEYNRVLQALAFDFSGLSSACMPCNAKLGLKRSAV